MLSIKKCKHYFLVNTLAILYFSHGYIHIGAFST